MKRTRNYQHDTALQHLGFIGRLDSRNIGYHARLVDNIFSLEDIDRTIPQTGAFRLTQGSSYRNKSGWKHFKHQQEYSTYAFFASASVPSHLIDSVSRDLPFPIVEEMVAQSMTAGLTRDIPHIFE